MRKIIQIVFFLVIAAQINAQELNCTISINAESIPGSNKQIFTTLENALNEYINQTRWTQYTYNIQERIVCNMTITLLEQDGSTFRGNIQVQSSRPVYNSSYLTPVFNFKDSNFSFQYIEYQPLVYNENIFQSNLVSLMTYYAYVILGMDAATFSQYGGIPFFTKAQDVVALSQQSGFPGWNQSDGPRTRFTLTDNLLSPAYKEYHTTMYQYHLEGLDLMTRDMTIAKEHIGESIYTLKTVYDARPDAFLLRVFMDSKSDEIVDVFSDGPRFDTYTLKEDLLKISPLNAEKWNEIK
jgi:hypothetical protein